jgi:transcriptional regulator with XRE-family HTH domain
MDIADKIEFMMKEHGISRYRLSKDTGIPYTTLTQILNGRTENPQVKALQIIANYFGKPIDYFIEKTESNSKIPEWATSKDKRDFKKMLEEDAPVMFDGVPLDEEDKEKIKRVIEAMFWDAKRQNKRKPIKDQE